VFVQGERLAHEGHPKPQEMIRDAVPGFRDRRHDRPRHSGRDGCHQRVQRPAEAEGHWVFAGGLASPSSATVIDNRDGEALFTDGPFLESTEYLAGFWIMEAPDLDVALKLAAEGSKACNRKVEVLPFL
jgi:hypothetical protein